MDPIAEFERAVAAGDDERAEVLVSMLGAEAEPGLVAMARSADADRRWWAIRALANVGGEDAVAVVVAGLSDPEAGVRAGSALALAHLYRRQPDPVRAEMGQISSLLVDDDGFVRQAAADALSLCGDDAVPVLASVLKGSHAGARARAAYALRKTGTMGAAEVLSLFLNDENHLVRTQAYECLDDLGLLENILLRK